MDLNALDDAAAAALLAIGHPQREHIGLLYEHDGSIRRTPTQTTDKNGEVKGSFAIPNGSLRGLFHNHPKYEVRRKSSVDGERERKFSSDDLLQANQLGVQSYISSGNDVRRYDPATRQVTDVLAQFPIDELRRRIMVDILGRDESDPLGLMMTESPLQASRSTE